MTKTTKHAQARTKPLVAIIGRPNVGKSTLFNRLIRERKSIVEDIPGVTRDRIYADTEWDGKELSLVDTGGFDPSDEEIYPSLIKNQIRIALDEAVRSFHVGNLYLNRKCTGALVGAQPFGGFNMSGTCSKAGGPDYLGLFLQQKSVARRR